MKISIFVLTFLIVYPKIIFSFGSIIYGFWQLFMVNASHNRRIGRFFIAQFSNPFKYNEKK